MLEMDGPSPANLVIFQVIGREVKSLALTSSDPSTPRPASGWTCSAECNRLFVCWLWWSCGGHFGRWVMGGQGFLELQLRQVDPAKDA